MPSILPPDRPTQLVMCVCGAEIDSDECRVRAHLSGSRRPCPIHQPAPCSESCPHNPERQEEGTPLVDAIRHAYWKPHPPCLPSLGEPCGDCHRCRDTSGSEILHCDGCDEDYDPREETHVGHEKSEPATVYEALAEVCRRSCAKDRHDPICRLLTDAAFGNQPLSDDERTTVGQVLHREGFYAFAVRARILDVFEATLAARRGMGGEW